MKKQALLLIGLFIICISKAQTDTIIITSIPDSALVNYNTTITNEYDNVEEIMDIDDTVEILELTPSEDLIYRRLKLLDESSPIDFLYNKSMYNISKY